MHLMMNGTAECALTYLPQGLGAMLPVYCIDLSNCHPFSSVWPFSGISSFSFFHYLSHVLPIFYHLSSGQLPLLAENAGKGLSLLRHLPDAGFNMVAALSAWAAPARALFITSLLIGYASSHWQNLV
jgi:hypothetical protein